MNYGYTCMRPNEPFEPFCDGKIFIMTERRVPLMNYGYTCMRPNEPFEPFCDGKIFIDQVGDVRMPAFEELTHVLEQGDLVTIPSLLCLGYTFHHIKERWERIRETGSRVVILDCEDLQGDGPELMDRMILYMHETLVDRMILYMHETLEQLKKSGRRNSLRRNLKQAGPKPKEIPAEFDVLSESYKAGRISSRAAAEHLPSSMY